MNTFCIFQLRAIFFVIVFFFSSSLKFNLLKTYFLFRTFHSPMNGFSLISVFTSRACDSLYFTEIV